GELQNPAEVLTPTQVARLAKARTSDATVIIRAPREIANPATRPKQGGTLTWHYRMENTRDVAFSASRAFAWDAARINLPGGKSSLA
ncbi:M1 family peptidase, partial [Klebsiella pneumoniae]